MRAGLVGATTTLATPLFPVIGFNQLAFRFLDPATRMALTRRRQHAHFSAVTLTPEAMRWAPLMLPFAVGNGATAGALYLGADVAAGGPLALQATGPVVGVALGRRDRAARAAHVLRHVAALHGRRRRRARGAPASCRTTPTS